MSGMVFMGIATAAFNFVIFWKTKNSVWGALGLYQLALTAVCAYLNARLAQGQ